MFGVLALVVLVFLMYGITSHNLLPSLASIPVSRGLITFLIAVVTVMIALILVLATVVSDSPDLFKRFSQGKEVLTMLIGVLGTIVGFYFGNPADGMPPPSTASSRCLGPKPCRGRSTGEGNAGLNDDGKGGQIPEAGPPQPPGAGG